MASDVHKWDKLISDQTPLVPPGKFQDMMNEVMRLDAQDTFQLPTRRSHMRSWNLTVIHPDGYREMVPYTSESLPQVIAYRHLKPEKAQDPRLNWSEHVDGDCRYELWHLEQLTGSVYFHKGVK